ncbi:hypothetical protein Droror1_Dr00007585 [Drosera rotundifolia]
MALTASPAAQTTRSSTLDPNAPAFIPMSYRAVEDFSSEWWHLVRSSPSFRDYWLQDYNNCSFDDEDLADLDSFFFDAPDLDNNINNNQEEREKRRDLIRLGWLNWEGKNRRGDGVIKGSKKDKAPKIVAVKVSPRMIHQPR